MSNVLDLNIEALDAIEAPLTDMEWGIVAGLAFSAGVAIGIAIVVT